MTLRPARVLRLSPNSRARALIDHPWCLQFHPNLSRLQAGPPCFAVGCDPSRVAERPLLLFHPDVGLSRPAGVVKIGGKN